MKGCGLRAKPGAIYRERKSSRRRATTGRGRMELEWVWIKKLKRHHRPGGAARRCGPKPPPRGSHNLADICTVQSAYNYNNKEREVSSGGEGDGWWERKADDVREQVDVEIDVEDQSRRCSVKSPIEETRKSGRRESSTTEKCPLLGESSCAGSGPSALNRPRAAAPR